MDSEYKAEKIASVSKLGGGGIWEINHVTLVAPAAVLLWSILQTRQSYFKPYTITAGIVDFLLNCCVILCATTAYSSAPQVLNGLLMLPAIATILSNPAKTDSTAKKPPVVPESNGKPVEAKQDDADQDEVPAEEMDPLPVKPFITTYRGALLVITCTSILAVDFPIFPRRFAKTEEFGTSLMDLGVGSFVFAAGIVAARQQIKERVTGISSLLTRLKNSMRHALPLAILGLIRLWSVKGLDYPEHVSEYGVHWNFFFTLALLSPAIALLQPILSFIPSYGVVALVIGIAYETILTPDMKLYLIRSPRDPNDWLSQNRDGVFSFIGYLAIFIAGMGIGTGILPRDPPPEPPIPPKAEKDAGEKDTMDEDAEWLASILRESSSNNPTANPENSGGKTRDSPFAPNLPKTTFFFLVKWSAIWSLLAVWVMWNYGPRLTPSRRIANLAYINWVCAFNTAQLLLFCAIESLMFPNLYTAPDRETEKQRISDATSKVMRAFNRNGLAIFLFANLLTGAVNVSVKTLYVDDVSALVVLVGYIGVVCGTALMLDHYDISIKL